MNIRINLDAGDGPFKPGSMVTGSVELSSPTPVELEEVELRLIPPSGCTTAREITGKLSREMTLQGTTTLPLAANIDRGAGRDADGKWKIEAVVRTLENGQHRASVPIHVAASTGQKLSAVVAALLTATPFLAVALFGMGFGISGIPEKIIPEGVLWFAFGGGIAAALIARAILGAKDPTAATPWLGTPLALALLAGAAVGVYITMVQPGLIPLRRNFAPGDLQSIFAVADHTLARPQIMGMFAAIVLATSAGGLLSRRQVLPALQMEIAVTAMVITCTLICLGFIGDAYQRTSQLSLPATEFLVAGIIGLFFLFSTFRRPTWTQAPAVTLLAGAIPLAIGLLGMAAKSSGTIETATAGAVALWGAAIMYLGGRNVLASAMSGRVGIVLSPNPISIGETLVVSIQGSPHSGVRMKGVTGTIRCEQHTTRWVNGDLRTDVYTLYKNREHVATPSTLSPGEAANIDLRFVIPLGSLPSDNGSQAVVWTVDVAVEFQGRPDYAEMFDITVTA